MPYAQYKRTAVPQQLAQNLQTMTLPAPTRGLVLNENESFMAPGSALVLDNWFPTLRGIALRGGSRRWCDVHSLDAPAWANSTNYSTAGVVAYDAADGTFWQVLVTHVSPATGTFADYRAANPTHWAADTSITRQPLISGFEYVSGIVAEMFAANSTKVFDVSSTVPVVVASGRTSGNYAAAQLANAAGDFLIAVNSAGDAPLRYDGTTWTVLNSGQITGPAGTTVEFGGNLVHVCKYRNRLFFVEGNSMNAWYLPLNAIQGALLQIPLSGAASKGGKLMFAASWSIDAGDGIDDKLVFVTDLGELLVFTGSDPSNAASWKQEGRYSVAPPMGMNCHTSIGGDLLIGTVDGIVPVSAAITKSRNELELAAITRAIEPMWRTEVLAKREWAWSIKKWDEGAAMFVTWPGGAPGQYVCGVANIATTAWTRFTGWDAVCFLRMRGDIFFGTQQGVVMQGYRTGYDDGVPYVATMVGGWEMFRAQSQTVVWHQSRASFSAAAAQPFNPQITATLDYVITVPTPPPPGPDPGIEDVWDQGLWDQSLWDQPSLAVPPVRNTGWVSVGMTGYSHAPIVQVTVAQKAAPRVALISVACTFERAGVNV